MPISWPAATICVDLLGERLDRVAGDEPGRLDAVALEQLEQPRACRPRRRTGRARCRRASRRRRRSRASRRPRRRRRRRRRESPWPCFSLAQMSDVAGRTLPPRRSGDNARMCSLCGTLYSTRHWAEAPGAGARGRRAPGLDARPHAPRRAAQPRAAAARARGRRLAGDGLRAAHPHRASPCCAPTSRRSSPRPSG